MKVRLLCVCMSVRGGASGGRPVSHYSSSHVIGQSAAWHHAHLVTWSRVTWLSRGWPN